MINTFNSEEVFDFPGDNKQCNYIKQIERIWYLFIIELKRLKDIYGRLRF